MYKKHVTGFVIEVEPSAILGDEYSDATESDFKEWSASLEEKNYKLLAKHADATQEVSAAWQAVVSADGTSGKIDALIAFIALERGIAAKNDDGETAKKAEKEISAVSKS